MNSAHAWALNCMAFQDQERQRLANIEAKKAESERALRSERAKRGWLKRKGLLKEGEDD